MSALNKIVISRSSCIFGCHKAARMSAAFVLMEWIISTRELMMMMMMRALMGARWLKTTTTTQVYTRTRIHKRGGGGVELCCFKKREKKTEPSSSPPTPWRIFIGAVRIGSNTLEREEMVQLFVDYLLFKVK